MFPTKNILRCLPQCTKKNGNRTRLTRLRDIDDPETNPADLTCGAARIGLARLVYFMFPCVNARARRVWISERPNFVHDALHNLDM